MSSRGTTRMALQAPLVLVLTANVAGRYNSIRLKLKDCARSCDK